MRRRVTRSRRRSPRWARACLVLGALLTVVGGGSVVAIQATVGAATNYTISFTTPGGVTVIGSISGVELVTQQVYTAYLFGTSSSAQVKLVRDR